MACPDGDNANATLITALTGPRRVSSDAGSVEQHSLPDLIATANYVNALCAASNRNQGLRFRQLIPSGTTGFRVRGHSHCGGGNGFGFNSGGCC